jgi:predicted Zn-dependent protease
LNPDEATNISAPRIRLHKVKLGETKNSLANKMPLGKFNDDWFKALHLNELSNGLKAGGTVKIVKN